MIKKDRALHRQKIKERIRKKVFGTPERPRFTVYRSLKHIFAQIIDDTTGSTLVAASTLSKDLREELKEIKNRIELAKHVGKAAAKKALEKNIQKVVFDRNGYMFHGKVKALADGAREGGLKF